MTTTFVEYNPWELFGKIFRATYVSNFLAANFSCKDRKYPAAKNIEDVN